MLPEDFVKYTKELMGDECWQRYLDAFNEDTPASIRWNPFKTTVEERNLIAERVSKGEIRPVPWCKDAYYLSQRPNFTLDPLLHAGVYYVQEAGSMFLDTVLRQCMTIVGSGDGASLRMLDLCAAPGGKSTLARAVLPSGSILMANEPDRRRANILMENIQKQGHPDVIVTNNYARDYYKAKRTFDIILADVPCSGEGMFRKDHDAIGEWSLANVMKCAQLQRSIIEDIWPCLRPGGILIYSTCTFNIKEDEENVRWITEELGAEIIPISISEEWNITGSLLKDWDAPVYRFIPGTTHGEGLFMAALRKTSDHVLTGKSSMNALRILSDGHYEGTVKGKNIIPDHAESLLKNMPKDKYPRYEVTLDDALHYLHHEALQLPTDVPRGFVVITYHNHPLGFVKNIGNRANNLYPQEWKIRQSI